MHPLSICVKFSVHVIERLDLLELLLIVLIYQVSSDM